MITGFKKELAFVYNFDYYSSYEHHNDLLRDAKRFHQWRRFQKKATRG